MLVQTINSAILARINGLVIDTVHLIYTTRLLTRTVYPARLNFAGQRCQAARGNVLHDALQPVARRSTHHDRTPASAAGTLEYTRKSFQTAVMSAPGIISDYSADGRLFLEYNIETREEPLAFLSGLRKNLCLYSYGNHSMLIMYNEYK